MEVDLFSTSGRWGGKSIADRIDATGDCWEWTGATDNGYGRVRVGPGIRRIHRVVWEALVGPIPHGLQLDHLCRNRSCCNPDHLEPVTNAENARRGMAGANKRAKTHCPSGHPYSGDNLCLDSSGYRECKRCRATRRKGEGSEGDAVGTKLIGGRA